MSLGGLVAILLGLVALASWRPLRRFTQANGLSHLTGTGHAFLLLGYGVSLVVNAEEMAEIVDGLVPIVAFISGWVGFAVGGRFDLGILRKVPMKAHTMALAPAFFAFLGVGALAAMACMLLALEWQQAFATALVVGGAAASSGPSLAATLRRRVGGRRPDYMAKLRMVEFSAGLDDVILVLAALAAFAWFRHSGTPIEPYWYAGLSLGIGALLGVATWLFLGGSAGLDERLLLGIAMIAFAAGFASWLDLSPSAVGAAAGFVLVNMPGRRMRLLMDVIHRVERPAVVILMTLVGFHIGGAVSVLMVVLLVAMTLWRGYLKYVGGNVFNLSLPRTVGLRTDKRWALALVSQGSLGLVVALSLHHVWRNEASLAALAAVGLASVINEFVSVPLFAQAFQPQQEAGQAGAVANGESEDAA